MATAVAGLLAAVSLTVAPVPQAARRLGVAGPGTPAVNARWWLLLLVAPGLFFGAEVVAAAVVGAWTVVRAIGRHRRSRAEGRRADDVAAIMDLVAGDLRAGAPPSAAMLRAAGEVGGVAGQLLHRAGIRAQLSAPGAPVSPDESEDRDARRLWTVLRISETSGLPLAGMLEHLSADLTARRAHRGQVEAALAGPRLTMWILAGLPLFGVGLGELFGARPLAFLGGGELGSLGGVVLVIGVALLCAGILWSVRLVYDGGDRR